MCRTGESQANTYMEVQESDLSKVEPGNQVAKQTAGSLHVCSNKKSRLSAKTQGWSL